MWSWDQGRMPYFQFDALRAISRFAVHSDLRRTKAETIRSGTGLDFPPPHYEPWRNYARSFKLCMIAREQNGRAVPTDVARILAQDGSVTCDEYLHFLAEATTDPSPALSDWNSLANIRYPLCFALRYILAKASVSGNPITQINEIIGAYITSQFVGGESEADFVRLLDSDSDFASLARERGNAAIRPARESIKFLCQISYLHCNSSQIMVSLSTEDATRIFEEIEPMLGPYEADGNQEIRRMASFFRDGSVHDFFDYQETTVSNELDSGFAEGSKVKRSHIVIERNSRLRRLFFESYRSPVCDACRVDTRARYPWTKRVLDMHHALPLSSGTRVDSTTGTLLEDLVALCPTCHRSIHRFYDIYLSGAGKSDFDDKAEVIRVYQDAKNRIRGANEHGQ